MTNLSVALLATAVFASLLPATGRIRENDGLGYDGVFYARMVTEGLEAGSPNTRLRPLVSLIARAIHRRLGAGVVPTFVWINLVSFFVLAFALAALLRQSGASTAVRVVFVVNVALCIATAQYFSYYPVQVDLAALALLVVAVHFVVAGPPWVAAIACLAAALSREFGFAATLLGVHRELRLRQWRRALLTYTPAAAAFLGLRMWVASGGDDRMNTPLSLLPNLSLWLDPVYVILFSYFVVTVFGGLSAILVVQPARCVAVLRQEHELITYGGSVLLVTAVGHADIWRYLAFLLPGVAMVLARTVAGDAGSFRVLAAVTLFTLVTQRPWRRVTDNSYFADWFPYYDWTSPEALPDGMVAAWVVRVALVSVFLLVLRQAVRRAELPPEAQLYHVRF